MLSVGYRISLIPNSLETWVRDYAILDRERGSAGEVESGGIARVKVLVTDVPLVRMNSRVWVAVHAVERPLDN